MRWFPKAEVSWKEPEEFRTAQDQREAQIPPWQRPLYVLILTALFMVGWELTRLNPRKHPLDFDAALPLIAAMNIFLLYGLPWLLRRGLSSVILYRRGIMKLGWQQARAFKSFIRYSWSKEASYLVLTLTSKKGRELRFGLSDSSLRQKIDPILRESGLAEVDAPEPRR